MKIMLTQDLASILNKDIKDKSMIESVIYTAEEKDFNNNPIEIEAIYRYKKAIDNDEYVLVDPRISYRKYNDGFDEYRENYVKEILGKKIYSYWENIVGGIFNTEIFELLLTNNNKAFINVNSDYKAVYLILDEIKDVEIIEYSEDECNSFKISDKDNLYLYRDRFRDKMFFIKDKKVYVNIDIINIFHFLKYKKGELKFYNINPEDNIAICKVDKNYFLPIPDSIREIHPEFKYDCLDEKCNGIVMIDKYLYFKQNLSDLYHKYCEYSYNFCKLFGVVDNNKYEFYFKSRLQVSTLTSINKAFMTNHKLKIISRFKEYLKEDDNYYFLAKDDINYLYCQIDIDRICRNSYFFNYEMQDEFFYHSSDIEIVKVNKNFYYQIGVLEQLKFIADPKKLEVFLSLDEAKKSQKLFNIYNFNDEFQKYVDGLFLDEMRKLEQKFNEFRKYYIIEEEAMQSILNKKFNVGDIVKVKDVNSKIKNLEGTVIDVSDNLVTVKYMEYFEEKFDVNEIIVVN